ncbi:hypothetical protein [Streptomyces sp. DSS69]|uniref:hypothetical protein n=1 Tax=unclassified Streptomyces TaxID=2593676 RepID=UPI0031F91E1B
MRTTRTLRTALLTAAVAGLAVTALPTAPASAASAPKFLSAALATCLDRLKEQDPGLEGVSRYHGRVNVAEGAHIYSIDTSHPEAGSTDIGLHAVGRDGRTVTVLEWGQLGDLDGAPLKGFRKTAGTAVAELH